MLRDVARQGGKLLLSRTKGVPARAGVVTRQLVELLANGGCIPAGGDLGEPLELGERQSKRLADIADRPPAAVGREARHERRPLVAVLVDHRRNQLLADVTGKVEVD